MQVDNKGFQGHLDVLRQTEVQTQPEIVRSSVPQQTFVPQGPQQTSVPAPQQTFVPQHSQQTSVHVPQQNFAAPLSFDIWEQNPFINSYDSNIRAYSVNYGSVCTNQWECREAQAG